MGVFKARLFQLGIVRSRALLLPVGKQPVSYDNNEQGRLFLLE